MTDKMIEKLEKLGFNRWTKGNMDRMYINAGELGLKTTKYNTGNLRSAIFNGEEISNYKANKLLAAKTYIDLATGEVHGTNEELARVAQELLDGVIAEETAEAEVTETENDEKENEMTVLVNYKNNLIDYYKVAVPHMDAEIREELRTEMTPCTEQAFFDAYCKKHEVEFGEDFVEAVDLDFIPISWLSDEELLKAAEECDAWDEGSIAWIREVYKNHDLDMDEVWDEEDMEDPQELLDYIKQYIARA